MWFVARSRISERNVAPTITYRRGTRPQDAGTRAFAAVNMDADRETKRGGEERLVSRNGKG